MASLAAVRERKRLAGASTPRVTGHSSAAHPAGAPLAEAAPAATKTTARGQVTQDSTGVHARATRDAAATPAHSAEQHDTAPVRLPAERARNINSAALSRSRSHAAADDVADTSGSDSGSSYAPSTADGAPEPGGAAGTRTHAGRASNHAAVSVLLALRAWRAAKLGYSLCCLSTPGLCCAP
jgi:hypothetical protein